MNGEACDSMLIPSTTKPLNVLHNKDDLGWRATAAEAQTAHCNAAAVWWGWGDGSEGSNLTTTPTEPLFNSISSLPPFPTICAPPPMAIEGTGTEMARAQAAGMPKDRINGGF